MDRLALLHRFEEHQMNEQNRKSICNYFLFLIYSSYQLIRPI